MNPTARANQLRERARHLRELAVTIEAMPAMTLERYADDATWTGERAQLCRSVLTANQHQLHAAADELRWHAYRFEREADDLDAAVRMERAG